MVKQNKYVIGKETNCNSIYDYGKVLNDVQKMFKTKHNKFPLSDSLYEVMYIKFTSACYDKVGWFSTYNGKWNDLADKISEHCTLRKINPVFESENQTFDELNKLVSFLRENNNTKIDFPMIEVSADNGRIVRYLPKMK